MTGDLKALGVSTDNFLLKQKKIYRNASIHFRDFHNHTVKLSDGKSFTFFISALSIEANSLLLEGDGFREGDEPSPDGYEDAAPVMLELRFYPKIEKHISKQTNRR
jgi:hypothetical protein